MKRIFPLIAAALACAAPTDFAHAQPTLSYAQPLAVRPGETTEVTLHGDKFEEPLAVWTSFAGQVEVVRETEEAGASQPNPKVLRLRVTVPQDAPPSLGGVVVGTKAGVSDPVWLMLDDLPTTAETRGNNTRTTPQEISPFMAVDAVSEGTQFDYFRFSAAAGQRVAIEVVGRRLGFNFDPVVRLLDSDGKELAFADDDAALGADCRLVQTMHEAGQYLIEVRDVQYRAGGRYRLRVGDFPLVSAPFPLGGACGASTEFRFAGPDGEAAAPVLTTLPDQEASTVHLAAKLPGGQSSCMTAAVVSRLPNALESEPSQQSDAAQEIVLPAAINGQFQSPGDLDQYRFAAKKGEKYLVRGLGRTLGSPSYLFLRLFDEKGVKLAEAGAGNEVESFTFATPGDGVYLLHVAELLQSGGPGYAYRIEIEPDQPRFALSLKNDKNVPHKFLASADGAVALDVQVARQGYNGPIRLSLDAPREGFMLRQEIIPTGANDARLLVLAPADLQEGELLALRVRGEAVDGEASAALTTAAILKTKRPDLLSVPSWLDGVLHVAVGPPPAAFFAMTVKETAVAMDRENGEATFVFPLQRLHTDYKADPVVFVEGLPPGVTASVKKAGKDQDERFEITLAGKELPTGEHGFQVLAIGDFNGRGMKTLTAATLKTE